MAKCAEYVPSVAENQENSIFNQTFSLPMGFWQCYNAKSYDRFNYNDFMNMMSGSLPLPTASQQVPSSQNSIVYQSSYNDRVGGSANYGAPSALQEAFINNRYYDYNREGNYGVQIAPLNACYTSCGELLSPRKLETRKYPLNGDIASKSALAASMGSRFPYWPSISIPRVHDSYGPLTGPPTRPALPPFSSIKNCDINYDQTPEQYQDYQGDVSSGVNDRGCSYESFVSVGDSSEAPKTPVSNELQEPINLIKNIKTAPNTPMQNTTANRPMQNTTPVIPIMQDITNRSSNIPTNITDGNLPIPSWMEMKNNVEIFPVKSKKQYVSEQRKILSGLRRKLRMVTRECVYDALHLRYPQHSKSQIKAALTLSNYNVDKAALLIEIAKSETGLHTSDLVAAQERSKIGIVISKEVNTFSSKLL